MDFQPFRKREREKERPEKQQEKKATSDKQNIKRNIKSKGNKSRGLYQFKALINPNQQQQQKTYIHKNLIESMSMLTEVCLLSLDILSIFIPVIKCVSSKMKIADDEQHQITCFFISFYFLSLCLFIVQNVFMRSISQACNNSIKSIKCCTCHWLMHSLQSSFIHKSFMNRMNVLFSMFSPSYGNNRTTKWISINESL